MSFNKIEKTTEILNVVSRGIGHKESDNLFTIAQNTIPLSAMFKADMFAPVFSGMADMLYMTIFPDDKFSSLFPTQIEKKKETLCYATLREREDFKLENSGYSIAVAHLMSIHIVKNVLMTNQNGKVNLNNLVNLWRHELKHYKEGEIIDLKNHRSSLIDYNMTMYPKIRSDLMEQRKTYFRNNIFN